MNDWDILETIRSEIHAEHNFLSHRMAWYAASQSFLMTAYAIAWGTDHAKSWELFFQHGIPVLGALLSIGTWLGIFSAVRVQKNVIGEQADFIEDMRKRFEGAKDAAAINRLDRYQKFTCSGREGGSAYHWMAMVPPCVIPFIFVSTWFIAWLISILHR